MQQIDVGRMDEREAAAVLGLEAPTGRSKYGPLVAFYRRDVVHLDGAPWAPPAPWRATGARLVRRWGMNGRVTKDNGQSVRYKTWLTERGARPDREDGYDKYRDGTPRRHALLICFDRRCAQCNRPFELTLPYFAVMRYGRKSGTARGFAMIRCPKCRAKRAESRQADPEGHKRKLHAARMARYRAKKRALAQGGAA